MVDDSKQLDRTAADLIVQHRSISGSGEELGFAPDWSILWGAQVDYVELNAGEKFSQAVIWFPELRWDEPLNFAFGDRIRLVTSADATVFSGFVTKWSGGFAGGDERNKGFERNIITCLDHRWLLSVTSPIYGQIARGPDDYRYYGAETEIGIDGSYTFFSGRRCFFNFDGKPDMDPMELKVFAADGITQLCTTPIFATAKVDPDYWTAGDIARHLLSPLWNKVYDIFTIPDPALIAGLDDDAWNVALKGFEAEGQNIYEALCRLCKRVGFVVREQYTAAGDAELSFYKVGSPARLHTLHAPAVGDAIASAVAAGRKMLISAELDKDIGAVINDPWGLGGIHKFEITVPLVPAWEDTDLEPDTSDSYANLFFTEAEIQNLGDSTAKNAKTYYKYYHPRGLAFKRDVGRKWALNETGIYTGGAYDRGVPFDPAGYIDPTYLQDPATGKKLYGPFNRKFFNCLTHDKDDQSSIGIKVEFSFDGGETWQTIPCSISNLSGEAGIYIEEANLAELVDEDEGLISGGDLDGIQLNYFSSLCDDKINERSFKAGNWKTRVRVTAVIQLDQRLQRQSPPSVRTGSPFNQRLIFNYSDKYLLQQRTDSSIFDGGELPAWNVDHTTVFASQLDALRDLNEDASICGVFVLDRLWLGSAGDPDFDLGDAIAGISGRARTLGANLGAATIYPEIIQIKFDIEKQLTKLLTRDLRFAEVRL